MLDLQVNMPGMRHHLVIPLPLLGSETKAPNQADLVGGVQVRICADSVCSLQVVSTSVHMLRRQKWLLRCTVEWQQHLCFMGS